jgi:hypothetical protein
VLNGDDLDYVARDPVVDDVRESIQARSADGLVLGGVKLGRISDAIEHLVNRRQELGT